MWHPAKNLFCRPTKLPPKWALVRTMTKKKDKGGEFVVKPCEVARFCEDALVAAGADKSNAKEVAHVIVAADYYGRTSHGILRLGWFVDSLCDGTVDGRARPEIIKETPATAHVEGCNALGPCIAIFCNNLAMKKARDSGIGYVCAGHANHFGIASYYTRHAADNGLIGIAMSVSTPTVVPHGGKKGILGTNPLSVAAPGCKGEDFVLDMATSNTSMGKIQELLYQKKKIPGDWALGQKGKPTSDPKEALEARALLPLGGTSGGHKGYGLAIAVDVLSSVLAGALSGPNVPVHGENKEGYGPPRHACLGQAFAVLDPDAFGDGFHERLSAFLAAIRSAEPVDKAHPVRVPGDGARKSARLCDCRGGIAYEKHQRAAMEKIVKRTKISPMKPN